LSSNFADITKETMATALKEKMRKAECPICQWTGYIDTVEGEWKQNCPNHCLDEDGHNASLRPFLHLPYDKDLFAELNLERYELSKTGKLLFNHPQGTHDDRFYS
jgi:hypothetical protein